jgi:cytochrome c oxidase cbb3-type subunit III
MDLRAMSARARRQISARLIAASVASCVAIALLNACGRAASPPSGDAAATPGAPPAIRYSSHLAAGQQIPPGADLHNPKASDPATIKAGETLFGAMNCDGCHGPDASGFIGPSLADGRWRYGGSDAEVFASIFYGRPKGMPAFGGKLGDDGVWTLVTYLKSLPVSPNIATESWEGP